MKKLVFAMVAFAAISFASCGGEKPATDGADSAATDSAAVVDSAATDSAVVVDSAATDSAAAPAEEAPKAEEAAPADSAK